jgi:hypothetical protein
MAITMKWLIARIMERGRLLGFRVVDTDTGKIKNLSIDDTIETVRKADRSNFKVCGKELHPIYGSGIESLPTLEKRGKRLELTGNDVVIVIGEIEQTVSLGSDNVLVGYIVTDYAGVIMELTPDELLAYENVGYHNAKVVNQKGERAIVPTGNKPSFVVHFRGMKLDLSSKDKEEFNSLMRNVYPDFKGLN